MRKAKGPVPLAPAERERLEECLAGIKSFFPIWLEYHLAFRRAYLGEPVTVEQEARFLQLKSDVARRHQYLFDQLGRDYVDGAYITDLLRSTINLEKVAKTQSTNYYKIENNWHRFYMNLQDTVTSIQFRLEQEDRQT